MQWLFVLLPDDELISRREVAEMEKFRHHSIPWHFFIVDKCFSENKKISTKTSSYGQNISSMTKNIFSGMVPLTTVSSKCLYGRVVLTTLKGVRTKAVVRTPTNKNMHFLAVNHFLAVTTRFFVDFQWPSMSTRNGTSTIGGHDLSPRASFC